MRVVKYLLCFFLIHSYNFIYSLTIEVPKYALCLCTMDIELDGDMDIITGHGWAIGNVDTLTIQKNNGNMEFEKTYITEPHNHHSLCCGLFNDDEYPDFVTGGRVDNSIRLFVNDGNGGFFDPIMISDEIGATDLITADFENDGDVDVFYFDSYYGYLGVLVNDGNANFNIYLHTDSYIDNNYIEVKDLNADLYPDIFLNGRIFINHLDWFEEIAIYNYERFIFSGDLGDFDNDGDFDVYFQGAGYPGYLEIGINDGEANFSFSYFCELPSSGFLYTNLKSEDLNIDGYYDIIYYEKGIYDDLYILMNREANDFNNISVIDLPSLGNNQGNPGNLYFADIDSDEDSDIIFYSIWPTTGEYVDYLIILFNDGEGNFTEEYVGIDDEELIMNNDGIKLLCYPNPFSEKTTIYYELPSNIKNTAIDIFNTKGQKVKALECNIRDIAASTRLMHSINWDGTDDFNNKVSSGIYLYRLISDERVLKTKKMILIK
ncbi:MAG: VCBS repeat-containing protein [Candidatus Cloacimonetes bacterium]|nr:VCBS repeat-containing protein [Candidatus Cloacimonadota bacterium]